MGSIGLIGQVVALALVVGIRLLFRQDWVGSVLLAVGWVMGYLLAEVDHLFYALVCNPQELSCMRVKNELENHRWRSAWQMLKSSAGERTRLPVRNVLTGLIVAVMAIWVVTSSGSMIASGVAVGLGVRLLLEFWQASDYKRWYWIFAREFGAKEHNLIKWVWTLLLGISVITLIR